MIKRTKVTIVGGGSYAWSPGLLNDMVHVNEVQNIDFYLLDLNITAAKEIAAFGAFLNKKHGRTDRYFPTTNRQLALKDAGQIVITITKGGLAAMGKDLVIPEKYGIFHTVGDTVGPGGWSRQIRNIPVFVELARDIAKYAPDAFVINYTNPMTVCTKTLTTAAPKQKIVGLCHNVFGLYHMLKKMFNCEEKDINLVSGGINHFFWLLDFKIKGEDGYKLFREKLGKQNMYEYLCKLFGSKQPSQVSSELYHAYGYLSDHTDRHICEFFSKYIAPTEKRLKEYDIVRTYIGERWHWAKGGRKRVNDIVSGKLPFDNEPSREICANILRTMATGYEFTDVMNLRNIGQLPDFPEGAVVETMGVANKNGFRPIGVGKFPKELLATQLPHVWNQNMIVEAVMEGNVNKAFQCLYNDPVCAHLTLKKVKQMGTELMKAHKDIVPKAFKM